MNRKEASERAEALVSRMTLEEKVSMLRYDSPAIERLGIPAYNWWSEALHGVARAGTATVFPQAIGLAAAFDEELMLKIGECIAVEGRAKYNEQSSRGDRDIYKGLTFWSPNVNIFRDPRWGRGHETYGEDPYLTGRLAVNFIRGIQGEGDYLKAAACAKHFAVHSGPEKLRHEFDARVSAKDLEETYLPAFEACVREAHVEGVMGAYNRTNGEPCCANDPLMEHLREWGFEGYFVSDCGAVSDFHNGHHVTGTPEESAALAVNRGCMINCGAVYQRLLRACGQGLISEETISRTAVRALTTRFMLGLFDHTEYDDIDIMSVDTPEYRRLAERAAEEGFVLLKNNGILPLDKESLRTIAVIGPNADNRTSLIGNYYGTASRYTTVLEGIQDEAGEDIRVLYSEGCHLWRNNVCDQSDPTQPDRIAEALACAEHADAVILVIGLDERLEGEEMDENSGSMANGDKTDLRFPLPQEELLSAMLDCGKPVIVVNMSGSAMDLREADRKAAAVIQAWYPGERGGKAAADILFGKTSPSGKLPVTFYEKIEDLPAFTDYSMRGRTYRYFEGTPLYPFGYGLTYGSCRVESVTVDRCGSANDFEGIILSARVRNDGPCGTDDVLQAYVKDEDSAFAVPNAQLAGFRRVHLEPGESEEIEIRIGRSSFTSVDLDGCRGLYGTRFKVLVGFNGPDERSRVLTGQESRSVEIELRN